MNTVQNPRILTNGQDLVPRPSDLRHRSWPATTPARRPKVHTQLQVVRVTNPADLIGDDEDEDDL
jgi:hypothetical protein